MTLVFSTNCLHVFVLLHGYIWRRMDLTFHVSVVDVPYLVDLVEGDGAVSGWYLCVEM